MPLLENDVKVIRHHDACEERVLEAWHGLGDVVRDVRANGGREKLRAVLGSRGNVEPSIWKVQSTLSRHAPRCTCGRGGAMANGAARHKCNVGPRESPAPQSST